MIQLDKPEPPEKYRSCIWCGRRHHLKGKLIHWPSREYLGIESVLLIDGTKHEPFSTWIYECSWCRAVETRQRKDREPATNPPKRR